MPARLIVGARRIAAALAVLVPAAAAAVDLEQRGSTDLQLTIESSRGRYGSGDLTRIVNAPVMLRYRSERWTAQVEVPFLQVDSVEPLVPGVGAVEGLPRLQRTQERGLGDIWLKLGHELKPFTRSSTGVDVMLKVKTRTGDFERGLGSGGTDVALQLEAYQAVGVATAWGQIGRRRTGDVPGLRRYRDPWYGELGAFVPVSDRCQAGGYYTAREPIGRLGALGEFTAYGACTAGDTRVQLYLTRGFKAASPQFAFGLGARYRF